MMMIMGGRLLFAARSVVREEINEQVLIATARVGRPISELSAGQR